MLEDEFGDVVAKARRGLGLEIAQVAGRTGIAPRDLERMEEGALVPGEDEVRILAEALALRPAQLGDLARSRWSPELPAGPEGANGFRVRCLTLANAAGITSNTYLLWREGESDCVVVDPGFEAGKIQDDLARSSLVVRLVAVTHGHHDHVGEAGAIARRWNVPIAIGAEDLAIVPPGARSAAFEPVEDGARLALGSHLLTALAAPGHTAGGRVYIVDGIAFVGDTLFASSIGRTFGGPPDYPVHLETVRKRVLGMPPETLLFPGHGPRTTVGEEREHNPFA